MSDRLRYTGPYVTRAHCSCGHTIGMIAYVLPFLSRCCAGCGAKKATFTVRTARWVQDTVTFWRPDKEVGYWEFHPDE